MLRSTWAAIEHVLGRLILSTLSALLVLGCIPSAGADDAPGDTLLLAVRLNDVELDEIVWFLRLPDGSLCASAQSLRAWRLLPVGEGIAFGDRIYFRLGDIAGLAYRVDPASQTLLLQAPATAFEGNDPGALPARRSNLSPVQPGGFFNYDLQAQRAGSQESSAGLLELGTFNRWGSGNVTALWNSSRPENRLVRLDTAWTLDFPEAMQQLRLGDAISGSGTWGRAVRFGGVQWASNFHTQPDYIPFALPTVHGAAIVPSGVDVFIDNVQRLHSDVQQGPFDLRSVPVITGQGEMQVVVRDQLGRQQIITQPYYVSQALLKPGVRDFSYEAGSLRRDYGSANASYGPPLLVANDRMGITPGFTRELRAEVLAEQQTVGAGGVWLIGHLGTAALNAAVSHGPRGVGRQLGVGFERQARDLSFGVRTQLAERDFVQVGNLPGWTPRQSLLANVGIPLAGNNLGVAYIRQTSWEGEGHKLLTASYAWRVGRSGQMAISALRNLSGEPSTTVALTLVVALDERTSGSVEVSSTGGRTQSTMVLQRNLPAGEGFGYRVLAGGGDFERYGASAVWQTERGTLSAEAASFAGAASYRVGVSGGVAVAGGGVFLSRRLDDSFAVVQVGDFAGVRVTRDNQEVGRTDSSGLILVTRLRAYQENPLGVEQADLPFDVEIDSLQLKLTPALRSGVVATFPVRRVRSASFRLVDEEGRALPPGSGLAVAGRDKTSVLGYDGLAFLSGLGARNQLRVELPGGRQCLAEVNLGSGEEAVPDLGTVICRRVRP